jgi:hypothetical protein
MATVTGDVSISATGTASLTFYSKWSDRPFLMLNGNLVTDHGRQTSFSVKNSNRKTLQTTFGFERNYYPRNSVKIGMSSVWKMLPDSSSHTFDSRQGRSGVKALASSKKSISLYVKKPDGSGYLSYDVFVSNYSENLVSRRNFDGGVLYDVSMEFTEL